MRVPKINDSLVPDLVKAVEQTADHVMITDKTGRIRYVNPAFTRTTGYTLAEVTGKFPSILKSGRHDEDYYKDLWRTILNGRTFKSTTANMTKRGKIYYADQTITPLKNNRGTITHFVSIWKDDTERVQTEQRLHELSQKCEYERGKLEKLVMLDGRITAIHELEELIAFLLDTIVYFLDARRCSIMLLDEKSQKLSIKGAVGLHNADIKNQTINLGQGIAGLVAKKGKPLLVEMVDMDKRIKRANRAGYKTQSFMSVPLRLEHKILGVVNVTDRLSSIGEVFTEFDLELLTHLLRRAASAIANAHMFKELKNLSITDYKTKLFNYQYFVSALTHECNRARRTGKPLSLMMIDLDNFKAYNDKYGHLQGDEFLRQFGAMLRNNLREVDISCRYGGDEFIVILPETERRHAGTVARKLLKQANKLKARKKLTYSIGVIQYDPRESVHTLVEKVDEAMYAAKKSGKDRLIVK